MNGKLQVSGTRIGEGGKNLLIKLRHVVLQFSPSVIRSIFCELGFVFCLLLKCEVKKSSVVSRGAETQIPVL